MLFRNHKGELIELMRRDFITDKEYYQAILEIKNYNVHPKDNNSFSQIIDLLKQTDKQKYYNKQQHK